MKQLAKSTVITLLSATLLSLAPIAHAASDSAAVFQLEEATTEEVNDAFHAGVLTSRQLVQLYLDRIAAYENAGIGLKAIFTVNPKALETAAALDRERQSTGPRGPLHGIPILLKDNIDTFDLPTSNGSVILKNAVPPDDAYITKALRDAGAVILGKAAMGEFAGAPYNTVEGQALNPYNFLRETGGSSSGSASGVAANLAVVAVGTDTSTSVRGPSSYNGIVGLRPTTGLISRDGIAPKNLTFDTAGPMARTVTDVAILLSTIAGPDPADPLSLKVWKQIHKQYEPFLRGGAGERLEARVDYTQFLKKGALAGSRLGVVRDFFGGDPEVDALAKAALASMREAGRKDR